MAMATLELSTTTAPGGGEDAIWSCIRSQRARTVSFAESLDPGNYAESTRCPDWSVRDVLMHLSDTINIFDLRVAGAHVHEFDPAKEPQELIDASKAETADAVLGQLTDSSRRYLQTVDSMLKTGDVTQVTWLYNKPIDWRLLAIHAFWDEWIHERDLRLPRDAGHRSGDDETRLAAAYGLMLCGLGPSRGGNDVHFDTTFSGIGGGTFRLDVAGDNVTVAVDADHSAKGVDAAAAVDSMAGRGPLPDESLDGDEDTLSLLSLTGLRMRGDQGRPTILETRQRSDESPR